MTNTTPELDDGTLGEPGVSVTDILAGRLYHTRTVDTKLAWALSELAAGRPDDAARAFRDITARCGHYIAREAQAYIGRKAAAR